MAYVNRGGAPEWVETHYRFQIRTFWIGLLYGVISLITVFILIGFLFALFTLVWWIVRCAKGCSASRAASPTTTPQPGCGRQPVARPLRRN